MVSEEQLKEYQIAYSKGEPLITDSEYDVLLEEYLREHGEDKRPFLRQKQSESVNSLVGTLPKVYGVTEPMRPKQKTYVEWMKNRNPEHRIIIQPKFDGCSVACDKAGNFFTRGDYDNGESVDVTDLFKDHISAIAELLHEGMDGLKFEAIMSLENFCASGLNKRYMTARDAVSGIMHSRNVEYAKLITLVPLRVSIDKQEWIPSQLQDISIVTTTAGDYDTIQQFITDKLYDGAKVKLNNLHYCIDGVVVSIIGEEDHDVLDEVAIKIINDINETRLIKVDFQFGNTGKITPVAITEPVKVMDGQRTVDHITLSTLKRVVELGLRYGDTVRIMYNIVPYLLDSLHDGGTRIELPTTCPRCGAPLMYTVLNTVRCTNPDCRGLKIGAIIRYAEKMKMMGISEATITKLFDAGLIKNISDLYTLKVEDIAMLEGFGETSAKNIINSIQQNSTDVPVARWLGALPFTDVDAKKWNMVLDFHFGRDELKKFNCVLQLLNEEPSSFSEVLMSTKIKGIGPSTMKAMHEGWYTNFDEMKKIAKYVTFRITTVSNTRSLGRVTLSGTRDASLIKALTNKGYNVDEWSKETKYLIIPDKEFRSSKVAKAEKLGIPILTINEAYKALL